ncbi:MAG: hypothetical protein R8G34_13450 [Paracoccaceae bacterium]|nr:hypothetical protein [Paracoccaceae bacterium]
MLYIPVSGGIVQNANAQAFDTLPEPILAFCRAGTRSTKL